MKSISSTAWVLCAWLSFTASAYAVPVLQVGAPGAPGEGVYANYVANSSAPTETDSAITSGNNILVGGTYASSSQLLLGGQYNGSAGLGQSWAAVLQAQFGGALSNYAAFNGKGAILVAAVPNGVSGALTVNGLNPFFTSATSLFPNNHDPVKDATSDFLFFDIGNFAKNAAAVPNFADETGAVTGEVKNLLIATSGFQWIHFDVMALATKNRVSSTTGLLKTALVVNPASHDASWKKPNTPFGVPEPATPLLLGLGLMGLLVARRARTL